MSHKGHIKAASSHSTSAHAPSTCKVSPQLAGFHALNHSGSPGRQGRTIVRDMTNTTTKQPNIFNLTHRIITQFWRGMRSGCTPCTHVPSPSVSSLPQLRRRWLSSLPACGCAV